MSDIVFRWLPFTLSFLTVFPAAWLLCSTVCDMQKSVDKRVAWVLSFTFFVLFLQSLLGVINYYVLMVVGVKGGHWLFKVTNLVTQLGVSLCVISFIRIRAKRG